MLLLNTLQCSVLQKSGVQRNVVRCNEVQCPVVQYVPCNVVRCNAMQCDALHCGVALCTAIQGGGGGTRAAPPSCHLRLLASCRLGTAAPVQGAVRAVRSHYCEGGSLWGVLHKNSSLCCLASGVVHLLGAGPQMRPDSRIPHFARALEHFACTGRKQYYPTSFCLCLVFLIAPSCCLLASDGETASYHHMTDMVVVPPVDALASLELSLSLCMRLDRGG